MAQTGYAGDISPKEAWKALAEQTNAVLIDVRTSAEWAFVGGWRALGLPWRQS